ncbi:MAG: ABC transporter permease [Candidatus Lokiarchaeota archaeon]|nr:ABC transporter permease [Candidatus Lokiarchaeota archaeon]
MLESLIQKKSIKNLRRILSKSYAISEKNIRMQLRFKYSLLVGYITPIISIIMPFFIFGKIFNYNPNLGPWNAQNYIVFLFISYNLLLMSSIITGIPHRLNEEKFWKTLPGLMVAPFNRFYLLIGYFISEFFVVCIPFFIIYIILLFIWPITFGTAITILIIYISIALIFSGIGLIIGVFAISNENVWGFLRFGISVILLMSCITYPFEIFPESIQSLIKINPIYYIIDIIRLLWIENNVLYTFSTHLPHIAVLLMGLIIFPLVGVTLFNYVYKKLGISGY